MKQYAKVVDEMSVAQLYLEENTKISQTFLTHTHTHARSGTQTHRKKKTRMITVRTVLMLLKLRTQNMYNLIRHPNAYM